PWTGTWMWTWNRRQNFFREFSTQVQFSACIFRLIMGELLTPWEAEVQSARTRQRLQAAVCLPAPGRGPAARVCPGGLGGAVGPLDAGEGQWEFRQRRSAGAPQRSGLAGALEAG